MRYVFPYAVAVLDLGAAAVYLYRGELRLALLWFCYGIASAALAGVK
jgi:hypothetical protein